MNQQEKNITIMIKERIKQKNPFADVILFGSHARGQSHKDSDWDILILLNQPNVVNRLIEKEYREELYEIELTIEQSISTFVFSKIDWEQKYNMTPLYQNIKRDGIYL
jgi:predicted nucleotidyltransferase